MAKLVRMPTRTGQLNLGFSREDEEQRVGGTEDWRERERALDVTASWIVEAPAGSGKTGLLIQRYLKLLAEGEVDRPEQVLAITFTKAATEEIRERVMSELEGAAAGTEVKDAFERGTRTVAEGALRRDRAMGWGLLENPRRLNVRTIDSVCGEIARSLPVTSGGGGGTAPVEEPGPMYREAARRTLLQLGGDDAVLTEALGTMLLHRDGSLAECEALIAQMLAVREQWGGLTPIGREELTEEWLEGTVRERLDRALEVAVRRGLTELASSIPAGFLTQLMEIAAEVGVRPGYRDGVSPMVICSELRGEPEDAAKHLSYWRALVHLVVTPSDLKWRKSFTGRNVKFETTKDDQGRLKALVAMVEDNPEALEALCSVSALPPARYPEDQWRAAKAFFRVLNRALAELQLVFAERGECDFVEPALLARAALRQTGGAEAFEAASGLELRHLLVDEMQDTSTSQYELIELLTEGWASEGKTVFLVGDPKQSIYLFRQARVERFVATMLSERLGALPVGRLRLTANFRSQPGLVRAFNADFARVFPAGGGHAGEVPFVAAEAVRATAAEGGGSVWHAELTANGRTDGGTARRRIVRRSALEVRAVLESWRRRPLPAGRSKPWKAAVLVRSRRELREIVAALKRDMGAGPMPFRAVKVEPLKERTEVLDLLALTRALKHPADRVAWWAVLRAPWCGLGLADLHVLAGEDDPVFAERPVMELVGERGELLGADGIARLERVWPVLVAALARGSRLRIAELVERTWRSLGGDAALDDTEMANARRFLQLLEEIDSEMGGVDLRTLKDRLEGLHALPANEENVPELMTIHGAKGLEWDVVLVPELERRAPVSRHRLLEWEEIGDGADEGAARVMLAPIVGRGEESEALNTWLRGIRRGREAAERRRLLYVACTRAREELHLFGTATVLKDGSVKAESASLLEAAWPAVEDRFRGVEIAPEEPSEFEGLALAAGEDDAEKRRPVLLERLPAGFDAMARFRGSGVRSTNEVEESRRPFERPEGSFAARSFGNAVHAFLELAADRLAKGAAVDELLREVLGWRARIAAVLRGDGLAPAVVERMAGRVVVALTNTLKDATGRWLLGARVDARSEYALTLGGEGRRRVRMDRVFRAGAEERADGAEFLWIVDYKTGSHGAEGVEAFLERERAKYAGQMEEYARASGEEDGVRVGLWYPMVGRLVWWVI